MPELLSLKQVAEHLHVSRQTVLKYIQDGDLEAAYIGNKYQFKPEWVESLIEKKRGKNKKMVAG